MRDYLAIWISHYGVSGYIALLEVALTMTISHSTLDTPTYVKADKVARSYSYLPEQMTCTFVLLPMSMEFD
jgi:hypothetical protein